MVFCRITLLLIEADSWLLLFASTYCFLRVASRVIGFLWKGSVVYFLSSKGGGLGRSVSYSFLVRGSIEPLCTIFPTLLASSMATDGPEGTIY
jgi:hypothetical protein